MQLCSREDIRYRHSGLPVPVQLPYTLSLLFTIISLFNMSAKPQIVLYTHPASLFGQKLELVLLLKRLPYSKVRVPITPPRSALELLGIPYRRIPVLAIGHDVPFINHVPPPKLQCKSRSPLVTFTSRTCLKLLYLSRLCSSSEETRRN